MNRVIKFRLRVENKVVGYEKWYEGKWSEERGHWLARPCWLYSKDGEYWNPEYIYHTVKDAFTSLLDKNGKEIYEGDILKETNDPMVVKVEWNDGAYWFCYNERNRWTRDWIRTQIDDKWEWEIIGNIYENPELLTPEET